MIVVYPFSTIDQDLALKNAQWMNELGGCKGHDALVIADPRCVLEISDQIQTEFGNAFNYVKFMQAGAEIDGWPEGANYFFRLTTAWLQNSKWPYFLWLEPDAIPLKEGWLDQIEAEYKRCQRKFMGDRVQVENIPLHMSGVGIYPNPLHQYAGEAYRAFDTAWDMAAKDQIVPQAYFTKLIEHAWKHPSFKDPHELTTQIRPEAVLFHASKDGSLIDLLRGRKQTPSIGAVHPCAPIASRQQKEPEEPGSPSPIICDIFIRTYPKDYPWLAYCLQAVKKYAKGFRKVWVVSPGENPYGILMEIEAEWKTINDETEDGYLAQQITKLYADHLTDYAANFILHIDSDVILTRPITPETFLTVAGSPFEYQVLWPYTPYSAIQTPWQPVTEKFMGDAVPLEFMRRFPIMVPRWLYPKLREFCFKTHRMPLCDYIKSQPPRHFSEFNALGAFAFKFHRDRIAWANTLEVTPFDSEPCAKQFRSWDGITPEIKAEIEQILSGTGNQKPSPSAENSASTLNPTVPDGPVPPQIKVLENDIWVLEGDQISQWIEQEGRLDHDQNLLPEILKHIKPGDTVVDAGAFVGDHALAYANAVGKFGTVYAFEPNPHAFECLKHNLKSFPTVHMVNTGLGDKSGIVALSGNNGNHGGAYVGEQMKLADIRIERLDDMHLTPDLIKIDVEGYELNVLEGGANMITNCQPKMVIEINRTALDRQNCTPGMIFTWLSLHNYDYKIVQENCGVEDPLYDIICLPKAQVKETNPWTREDAKKYINLLKAFADSSPQNKSVVMQGLVRTGLKQPNPKNKEKNKRRKKRNEDPFKVDKKSK